MTLPHGRWDVDGEEETSSTHLLCVPMHLSQKTKLDGSKVETELEQMEPSSRWRISFSCIPKAGPVALSISLGFCQASERTQTLPIVHSFIRNPRNGPYTPTGGKAYKPQLCYRTKTTPVGMHCFWGEEDRSLWQCLTSAFQGPQEALVSVTHLALTRSECST